MSEERNEEFDEMLDEVYEPYKMGELTFYPSQILFDCDPIAYRISVSEYFDFKEQERQQEQA